MAINSCPIYLRKQLQIDELKEENKRFREALRPEQRKMEDGALGLSKPSSKIPAKPNAEQKARKPRGTRVGHPDSRRKGNDESVDRVIEIDA